MSSTGGGIVVGHNSLKIFGSIEDLKALADTTSDEKLKAVILEAINPPPDIVPGEPSTD